jgi:ribonuclease E
VPIDVATYLLNEKRNEFHSIETRLKVNVLLIPNVSLETPNYTVTRLRHDELNQNDIVLPSYKMADVPAEPAAPSAATQKPEAQRPQPAVQGITPSQPAPMATPREQPGPSILEKIFGWLTRKPQPSPEPVKARPREPQRHRDAARRDHRHGRPEARAEGSKRDEQRRGPRQDADARRDQGRSRVQEQAERKPQDRQQQPQQRPPRQDQTLAAVEQRQPGDRPAEGPREEGRGRRRGRGRRDRQPEQQQDNPNQQPRGEQQPNRSQSGQSGGGQARPPRERAQAPSAIVPEDLQPIMVEERPVEQRPMERVVAQQQAVEQPIMREHAVEEIKHAEFAPAAMIPEQLPPPVPVIERPEVQPIAPQLAAPAWKMEPVALPSDLVMIETQSKGPSTYQEPEVPRPARTPRPRYQPQAAPEEPLQQVETGKHQSAGSDAA